MKKKNQNKNKKTKSHVREHFGFLDYLRTISPKRQKLLLKGADSKILAAFSEIALNLMKKNIQLKPKERNRLKPYEKQVYQLSLRKNTPKKKKEVVLRGGFLGALISTIVPVLLSTILAGKRK